MGQATIFAGQKIKALKSTLSLNGGADIISSDTNPQTSAVSAEPGSLLLNTTSGTMYRKLDSGSSTNWVEVGAGSGGKNYIKNPDFDGGATTNWSMQKVSLSSLVPTGNIGAADAGHTISASSSSPLEGANSLLVDGASAFTAGNCLVSKEFAIDREDMAKVMGWSFYYEAVTANMDFSGTSANTWAVYIAEVTTATPDTVVSWIQPAGVYNLVQGSGVGLASGTFQTTATGTAYRLVLVCINSEAAATTLKVDDFQLGPQKVLAGAAVSDWKTFTPTVAGISATASGLWRRVGDSAEFQIALSTSGAASGDIKISVGGEFSFDYTKLSAAAFANIGSASANDGSGLHLGTCFTDNTSTNTFFISGDDGQNIWNATVPFTWAGTRTVSIQLKAPIQGWSSNTVLSQDTDTRVVAARYEVSGARSGALSGAVVNYDTKIIDTHSAVTTGASWSFRAPISGIYRVTGQIEGNSSGAGLLVSQIRKNGTVLSSGTFPVNSATNYCAPQAEAIVSCNAGDLIDIYESPTTGSWTKGGIPATNYVNIERLSGPATIAASETVAMARVISSAISVPTGVSTPLNFQYTGPSPQPVDTHNAYRLGAGYNSATGTWTTVPGYVVPVSGVYSVSATLLLNGTAVFKQLFLTKNTAQFAATANDNTFGSSFPLTTSGIVKCNAGDVLSVYYFHNTGSNVNVPSATTAAWNTFNVERIG